MIDFKNGQIVYFTLDKFKMGDLPEEQKGTSYSILKTSDGIIVVLTINESEKNTNEPSKVASSNYSTVIIVVFATMLLSCDSFIKKPIFPSDGIGGVENNT